MESSDKLVRSNNELVATGKSLLTLQEQSLLSELDLTATNSKTVLEPRLGAEFARALADLTAEEIEAGFRAWRAESPFFPAISDIRQKAMQWRRDMRLEREEQEQAERRRQLEAARERGGEILEFSEVLQRFNDIVDREAAAKLETKASENDLGVPKNAEIVITQDRREIIRQQIETVLAKYGK